MFISRIELKKITGGVPFFPSFNRFIPRKTIRRINYTVPSDSNSLLLSFSTGECCFSHTFNRSFAFSVEINCYSSCRNHRAFIWLFLRLVSDSLAKGKYVVWVTCSLLPFTHEARKFKKKNISEKKSSFSSTASCNDANCRAWNHDRSISRRMHLWMDCQRCLQCSQHTDSEIDVEHIPRLSAPSNGKRKEQDSDSKVENWMSSLRRTRVLTINWALKKLGIVILSSNDRWVKWVESWNKTMEPWFVWKRWHWSVDWILRATVKSFAFSTKQINWRLARIHSICPMPNWAKSICPVHVWIIQWLPCISLEPIWQTVHLRIGIWLDLTPHGLLWKRSISIGRSSVDLPRGTEWWSISCIPRELSSNTSISLPLSNQRHCCAVQLARFARLLLREVKPHQGSNITWINLDFTGTNFVTSVFDHMKLPRLNFTETLTVLPPPTANSVWSNCGRIAFIIYSYRRPTLASYRLESFECLLENIAISPRAQLQTIGFQETTIKHSDLSSWISLTRIWEERISKWPSWSVVIWRVLLSATLNWSLLCHWTVPSYPTTSEHYQIWTSDWTESSCLHHARWLFARDDQSDRTSSSIEHPSPRMEKYHHRPRDLAAAEYKYKWTWDSFAVRRLEPCRMWQSATISRALLSGVWRCVCSSEREIELYHYDRENPVFSLNTSIVNEC